MNNQDKMYLSPDEVEEEIEKIYAERDAFRAQYRDFQPPEDSEFVKRVNHPMEEEFMDRILDVLARRNPEFINPHAVRFYGPNKNVGFSQDRKEK